MNKKRLILYSVLSGVSVVVLCVFVFALHMTPRDYLLWFFSISVVCLPIILLLKELEKLVKKKSILLRVALKWPFVVWVVGVFLSAVNVLLFVSKGL